eukprot:6682639-Pyramimonas_sp.AAC.1
MEHVVTPLESPPLICAHGGDTRGAHPNTVAAIRAVPATRAKCVEVSRKAFERWATRCVSGPIRSNRFGRKGRDRLKTSDTRPFNAADVIRTAPEPSTPGRSTCLAPPTTS